MSLFLNPIRTDFPFEGMTEKQKLACALRFYGNGAGPLPLSRIAERLGINRMSALRLIRRGLARLRANGYDVSDLKARARLSA